MAEFQEVIRQWARMCKAVPGKSECKSICSDKESGYVCPLKHNGLCCKAIESQTDEDVISGENISMLVALWIALDNGLHIPPIAWALLAVEVVVRFLGWWQRH